MISFTLEVFQGAVVALLVITFLERLQLKFNLSQLQKITTKPLILLHITKPKDLFSTKQQTVVLGSKEKLNKLETLQPTKTLKTENSQ